MANPSEIIILYWSTHPINCVHKVIFWNSAHIIWIRSLQPFDYILLSRDHPIIKRQNPRIIVFSSLWKNKDIYAIILLDNRIYFLYPVIACNIDYSQTSFDPKSSAKMCWISYGKLTQIDKQSHNLTVSTLPQVDHALSWHAKKYHDCRL